MSYFKIKKLPLAISLAVPALCLLCSSTLAADVKGNTLPTVTVSDSKSDNAASGVAKLDKTNIAGRLSGTSDSASLLSDIPGVSLYGAGGVSSLPAIHGLADDRLRIKVDGMDLLSACPNHMNPALSYMDPTQVDGVKVYAGIAPVSSGGDSIGGTILVDSAPPEFAQPGQGNLLKGQAGTFYRSNGNATGANLSVTAANEKLSMTYSASTAKSDNYRSAAAFKAAGPAATDGAGGPAARPRGWLDGDEVGSTAYKSSNQSLKLALRHDNHLVDLTLGYQDIPYELYPNQRMDMLGNTARRTNLHYSGRFGWGVLDARAYQDSVDHFMDFGPDKQYWYGPASATNTVVAPGMPMYTTGKTTGAAVKADIVLSERDVLNVGAEVQHYLLNDWWPPSPSSLAGMQTAPGVPATSGGMAPNTFWNVKDGKRDRTALFTEWDARWNPQWNTSLGARVEQVDMDAGAVQGYNTVMAGYNANAFNALDRKRTDHNLDLTALARYTLDASRTFDIGFAQKTRSPNLYERYDWSKHGMALIMNNFVGDGNGYLGDPNLKPEVAHTLSATADWHDTGRAWQFKATPYYTRVTDFIDAVRCTGSGLMMNALCGGASNNSGTNKFFHLQFANQSARLYGIDLSGHFLLARTEQWGEFTASGVLNYVRGTNETTGDDLYNIMPLNAKLTVAQKLGNWSHRAELQLVSAKTDVSDVRQEMQTPGYGLVNLRASYEPKQVRVDFGVENLFDKFYALPLGGAYSGQGSTMSLNTIPWGIPVPGKGRSVYVGLNIKF
jgi:iron complex outermembrane receptor protein